jgi:hypothetical protein
MLAVTEAIQIERKTARRSGLQGEAPGSGVPDPLPMAGAFEAWGFCMF